MFSDYRFINHFHVESECLENYNKDIDIDTIHYTYSALDKEFFYQFHLENEYSGIAIDKLEKVIVDIISNELSIK